MLSNFVIRPKINEDLCTDCGQCARDCPSGAPRIDDVAKVDHTRCMICGNCVQACPSRHNRDGPGSDHEDISETHHN